MSTRVTTVAAAKSSILHMAVPFQDGPPFHTLCIRTIHKYIMHKYIVQLQQDTSQNPQYFSCPRMNVLCANFSTSLLYDFRTGHAESKMVENSQQQGPRWPQTAKMAWQYFCCFPLDVFSDPTIQSSIRVRQHPSKYFFSFSVCILLLSISMTGHSKSQHQTTQFCDFLPSITN